MVGNRPPIHPRTVLAANRCVMQNPHQNARSAWLRRCIFLMLTLICCSIGHAAEQAPAKSTSPRQEDKDGLRSFFQRLFKDTDKDQARPQAKSPNSASTRKRSSRDDDDEADHDDDDNHGGLFNWNKRETSPSSPADTSSPAPSTPSKKTSASSAPSTGNKPSGAPQESAPFPPGPPSNNEPLTSQALRSPSPAAVPPPPVSDASTTNQGHTPAADQAQPHPTETTPTTTATPPAHARADVPYARPVPGRKGWVYPPGTPDAPGSIVDVRDLKPGQLARDPRSKIVFRVP